MFNFALYKNEETNTSSTDLVRQKYESDLIQLLSLPLLSQSRQLEMPLFVQGSFQEYDICGEGLKNQYYENNQACSKPSSGLNEI